MKHSCFPTLLLEAHDLSKVDKNYYCDLPKVSKILVTSNFNLTQVKKMT